MYTEALKEKLSCFRLIPVVVLESADDALRVADALIEGGFPVIEVTFRTGAAAKAIESIVKNRPEMTTGAGTVLSEDNVKAAADAGASFCVAPGLNPHIVKAATGLSMPFIPGVCTPTEIEAALSAGCSILKFFPAGTFGGIKALTAISAPYRHTGVRFVPTGGVNEENLKEYLSSTTVISVGGTWLVTSEDISGKRWSDIITKCKRALSIRDAH